MVDSRRVSLTDVETTVSIAGPGNGPPVVLLHGFPDDRHGWDRQIATLADAGFRVIAIDQRGCGEAGSGATLGSYSLPRLVDDVEAALEALEIERAHLVGHDWGGAVAWTAAIDQRPWLGRVAVLNVPHPGVFARFVRSHPTQLLRSWYMLFFQIPRIPEWLLGARNGAVLSRALTVSSTRRAFTRDELERYRSMWATPGRIESMLNWYRAARVAPIPTGRVAAPTLIVWGDRDVALDARMADLSGKRCDDVRIVHLEDATHWPHRDQPDRVTALLVEHLGE